MDDNLHAGHRERMIKKFLSDENLPDHEILEIILYSVVPRKDTNSISHRLISAFGELTNVLNAPKEELMSIEGVGEKVTAQIKLFSLLSKKVASVKKEQSKYPLQWTSLDNQKEEIFDCFSGVYKEKILIFLLDEKRKRIAKFVFESPDGEGIVADIPDIAKSIALYKPKFVVACHNHPSDVVEPSFIDDLNTKKLAILCSIHGATLMDSVIVGKISLFSYFLKGRLEQIYKETNLDSLLIDKEKINE